MGLFDKKYCDICGEKIGLFGNRKLEDGNMCKHCAKKLSPWFDDRRHSTLEEIKEQLAYREENKKAVADFRCSLELGENPRILFDENAGTFMVSAPGSAEDRAEENPDVFSLDQVTGADMDVDEYHSELYREDRDGNKVSYNPPRYRYTYRFYINIKLSHPYVDDIRFQLNQYGLEIERTGSSTFSLFGDSFNPNRDYEYRQYDGMGREIIDHLLHGKRPEQPKEQVPQPEPVQPTETEFVVCPYCGSTTRKARFCENCGGHLE